MADKGKDKGADADVDVLLKGLLSQPGVDGVLIYNDLGACRATSTTPCSTLPLPAGR
jgi:hypothetical protein